MKNKENIKRFAICAIVYLIASLASFFAGYYANTAHRQEVKAEETVWETAYVTEYDYTSAESVGDTNDNRRRRY